MKFIKKLVFLSLLIFTNKVHALGFLDISLSPEFGLLNGTINEYVFDSNCSNTDNKLSQLNWDVKNIPYFKLEGNIDLFKFINANVKLLTSIPKTSGLMQDYDWQNSMPDYPYGKDSDGVNQDPATELTDYSKHDNHLDNYFSTKISLGINIFLPLSLKLTPILAYEYNYIKFTAKDGFGIYKEINKKIIENYEGSVCIYEQELNSFQLGLKASMSLFKILDFGLSFYISPKLSYMLCLDNHLTRSTKYLDTIKFASTYNFNAYVFYNISKHQKLGLSFTYDYYALSKGPNYTKEHQENTFRRIPSAKGGEERKLYYIAMTYTLNF